VIQVQTSSPDLVAAIAAHTAALQAHTAALQANTAALQASQPPAYENFEARVARGDVPPVLPRAEEAKAP
jgi:hypothetical protein